MCFIVPLYTSLCSHTNTRHKNIQHYILKQSRLLMNALICLSGCLFVCLHIIIYKQLKFRKKERNVIKKYWTMRRLIAYNHSRLYWITFRKKLSSLCDGSSPSKCLHTDSRIHFFPFIFRATEVEMLELWHSLYKHAGRFVYTRNYQFKIFPRRAKVLFAYQKVRVGFVVNFTLVCYGFATVQVAWVSFHKTMVSQKGTPPLLK